MTGVLAASAGFLFGALAGGVHAVMLYRAVLLLAGPERAGTVVVWHAARLLFIVAAFWLVAQVGAVPLVSAAAGFTIAQIAARQMFGPR